MKDPSLGGKRNRTVFVLSAVLLALATPWVAAPEAKPNFSGTWEMDAERSESTHSGDTIGTVVVVIKQTDSEFSVETRRDGRSETIVYKMDGSETEKPAPDNGPYRWRLRWDGSNLRTDTSRNINSTA